MISSRRPLLEASCVTAISELRNGDDHTSKQDESAPEKYHLRVAA